MSVCGTSETGHIMVLERWSTCVTWLTIQRGGQNAPALPLTSLSQLQTHARTKL